VDESLPLRGPSAERDRPHDPTDGEVRAHSTYVPSKGEDVLELDLGDGIVLFNGDSTLVHHLNPTAAIVWHLCTGEATVAELARDIAQEYDLDAFSTEAQVAGVIGELDALGLVIDSREDDQRKPTAAEGGR